MYKTLSRCQSSPDRFSVNEEVNELNMHRGRRSSALGIRFRNRAIHGLSAPLADLATRCRNAVVAVGRPRRLKRKMLFFEQTRLQPLVRTLIRRHWANEYESSDAPLMAAAAIVSAVYTYIHIYIYNIYIYIYIYIYIT